MTDPAAPDQRPQTPGSRHLGAHYRRILALLLALVVGVVLGARIVAIYSGSDDVAVPAPPARGSSDSSTGPPTTTSGSSVSGGADIQLSAACVRAVNDAQNVYTALGGLDAAIQKLDLTKVDGIVRQLQVVQRRLKVDVPACHAGIQLPSGSASAPSTAPSTATRG